MTDPWIQIDKGNKNNETVIARIEGEGGTESHAEASLEESKTVNETKEEILEFEDNFAPTASNSTSQQRSSQGTEITHHPLPDSQAYLEGLERKLQKIRKSSKLVEALAEKRQDCWRSLLDESNTTENVDFSDDNERFELDAPINSSDSTVQEIYRHLQPVQPVTVGETVHIVRHDQLDQLHREYEELTEEEDTPASR